MSDLIRRQDVIDVLAAMQGRCTSKAALVQNSKIWQQIKDLPPAQPDQCWIPCSERLPERDKDVLVTRDYDGREDCNKSCRYVEVASCYGEEDDIIWNSYSDEYKMTPKNHHVIAWMPLPEPWEKEE